MRTGNVTKATELSPLRTRIHLIGLRLFARPPSWLIFVVHLVRALFAVRTLGPTVVQVTSAPVHLHSS
jgi:hypothetical protein